ncbi:MAG: cation:proton antiporter [Actinomycetia bacterium]|nr:cation:proton antiporter [Actinomycetes bacterium]
MSLESLAMLVVILAVAVLAPFVADHLARWVTVPTVVVEILLGICVGPALFGLVKDVGIVADLADLGLAFLMFIAGYEIEFARLRGDPLKRASWSWAASLLMGLAIGLLLAPGGAGLVVGLALTTTALSVIVPIIRDSGDVATRLGGRVLAVGTVGEFGPILAIAFVFSGERAQHTLVVLAGFTVFAVFGAWLARRPRHPRLERIVSATLGTSAQVAVRICVLTVVGMFTIAQWLGLDPVLGAFTAGILVHVFLGSSDPEEAATVQSRLEGIGFGFLIPVFFVMSGVDLDIESLVTDPLALATVPLFLALMAVVRGVPTFVFHRGVLDRRDRAALGLFASTGLPLIVVITTVGIDEDVLSSQHAAALVTAGLLSVLAFPQVAAKVRGSVRTREGSVGNREDDSPML